MKLPCPGVPVSLVETKISNFAGTRATIIPTCPRVPVYRCVPEVVETALGHFYYFQDMLGYPDTRTAGNIVIPVRAKIVLFHFY
jgi:hypothetical protein